MAAWFGSSSHLHRRRPIWLLVSVVSHHWGCRCQVLPQMGVGRSLGAGAQGPPGGFMCPLLLTGLAGPVALRRTVISFLHLCQGESSPWGTAMSQRNASSPRPNANSAEPSRCPGHASPKPSTLTEPEPLTLSLGQLLMLSVPTHRKLLP